MYGKNLNLLILFAVLSVMLSPLVFPGAAEEAAGDVGESVGTVVIATVEGDSHSWGKDSIANAFAEEGFEVINLGTGVPAENFASKAREAEADVVFSSASMSTTMIHQIQIEEQLKAAGIRDEVITGVGGSLVTQTWADQIGADIYSTGPEDAVAKTKAALLKDKIPDTHIPTDGNASCGSCHA